jgi:glycosyltransferase involved in cell wall biosynthesis
MTKYYSLYPENNDLVSVIIPCRNAEKTILSSLQSLEKQTHNEIEIIIIDDNSFDNTLKIIQDFKKNSTKKITIKPSKIRIGAANARNIGLQLAKGNFVSFQDADDISDKNRIKFQLLSLKKQPSKIMSRCLYSRFNDKGIIKVNGKKIRPCTIAILFRKESVLKYLGGLIQMPIGEDSEFRERIITFFGSNCEAMLFIPLYLSRFNAKSTFFGYCEDLELSNDNNLTYSKLNIKGNQQLDFYRNWHTEIKKGNSSPNKKEAPVFSPFDDDIQM